MAPAKSAGAGGAGAGDAGAGGAGAGGATTTVRYRLIMIQILKMCDEFVAFNIRLQNLVYQKRGAIHLGYATVPRAFSKISAEDFGSKITTSIPLFLGWGRGF